MNLDPGDNQVIELIKDNHKTIIDFCFDNIEKQGYILIISMNLETFCNYKEIIECNIKKTDFKELKLNDIITT